MTQYFKSVLEQDTSPVVLCDCDHKILYMNPVAVKRYAAFGGEKLLGANLMNCHNANSKERILEVLNWFKESTTHNVVHTTYSEKDNLDIYMVALRDDDGKLIGYYEKFENRTRDLTPVYHI